MKVRCSTTSISASVLYLCLLTSLPQAFGNASSWNELTIKLPLGAMWNFLAPLGFANLGVVAIGFIVLWTGYRKKERWAWFVMLNVLLFFYFPSYVLPVLLQSQRFGWPRLQDFLGIFWAGGWCHCWIASMRPNYSVGIACAAFDTVVRPFEFLVMSIALLLPVKAFFFKSVPPQPGMQTRIAALSKKQVWIWLLALLLAIAFAFTVRGHLGSSQNCVAENRQRNLIPCVMPFAPPPMVFVNLAKAENAVAMPDAGTDDAIVVAVNRDGAVFLGLDKVDSTQLGSQIRDKLLSKTDRTVFLRVDARAKYQDFENVIDAMRSAGAEEFGLLTQRKQSPQFGDYLWIGNPLLKAVGIAVIIPSPSEKQSQAWPNDEQSIVVHVTYRPNAAPAYTISDTEVAHAELQSKLAQILASRPYRVMWVMGDGNLKFSDIAEVIDIGSAANVDRIGLLTQKFIRQSGPHQARSPFPKPGNHAKSARD
jgi:biopolymer transport protein ExbD